jgi:hypothetical protein
MSSEPTTAENGNVRTEYLLAGVHACIAGLGRLRNRAAGGDDRHPDFLDRVEVTVAGPLRSSTGFLSRRRS